MLNIVDGLRKLQEDFSKLDQPISITGADADILLYALDAYLKVDHLGKVKSTKHGYTRKELQSLRDRLMAIHEHKE